MADQDGRAGDASRKKSTGPIDPGQNGTTTTSSSSARRATDRDLDLDLSALNHMNLEDHHHHHHHSSTGRNGNRRLNAFDDTEEDPADQDALGLAKYDGEADDEDLQEEELPEHACAYCGIHDTSCVIKCLGCNKW